MTPEPTHPTPLRAARAALILAAPLALAMGCATPQPTARADAFSRADADGDAVVAAAEWDRLGDAVFAAADADGDGALDDGEAAGLYAALDLDGDGVLQPGEADAPDLDRDRSGGLSLEEWDVAELMRRFDLDRDGRITQAEFRRRQRDAFSDVDGNRDGRLRRRELDDGTARLTVVRF